MLYAASHAASRCISCSFITIFAGVSIAKLECERAFIFPCCITLNHITRLAWFITAADYCAKATGALLAILLKWRRTICNTVSDLAGRDLNYRPSSHEWWSLGQRGVFLKTLELPFPKFYFDLWLLYSHLWLLLKKSKQRQ